MQIPNDPHILISYVNLKLRDYYSNLEAFCDDMNVSQNEIEKKLNGAGYFYDRDANQFK